LRIRLQILFPSGATLYYGRVSPNDIPVVVNQTILKGKIVAGLLRGGNNVVRGDLRQGSTEITDKTCAKKGKTLLEW
jgi:(2Fe-2S) ferredoxin